MPATLITHAKEKSTYVITVDFTDEDEDAVIPDSILWTLSNTAGTIINSREDVAVAVPAAEIDILLFGDDLQILSGEANLGIRTLTINAVYDSDLGLNLPLKASIRFLIDNLLKVS